MKVPELIFLHIFLFYFGNSALSQNRLQWQFARIHIDNDFLNFRGEGTDRNYTNGTKLDVYYTIKRPRHFLDRLLVTMGDSATNLYGVGIAQLIYTPNDITKKNILQQDRPYAGVLYVNHSLTSAREDRRERLSTEIKVGILGEKSYAKEVQTWFHDLIDYKKPMGWDNQIHTDVLLNYQMQYERLLAWPSGNFEIIGLVEGNLGTYQNNAAVGLTLRLGKYNSYFSTEDKLFSSQRDRAPIKRRSQKQHQFYFFMSPRLQVVMNDASLQGGFFTHDRSPYVLKKDALARCLFQYEWGVAVALKRFGLSYSELIRTQEYQSGIAHQIGRIILSFGL